MSDKLPVKSDLENSTISRRKRFSFTPYLLSLLFCVIILFTSQRIPRHSERFSPVFDWSTVEPTSQLKWKPCLPNRECARLAVPLDYNDPTGEKAAIALIRIPARISPSRGPILFNPGGPGGSGVNFVHLLGESFQNFIGYEYDIVGFDPRGVGMTTPQVSSFADEYERAYWDAGAPPLINSTSDDSFFRTYVRAHLFGDLSVERTMHAAQHVSTATVATDMLTITRAHGRDRLLYWGFSYGTVLGATYAAMFPDNVERLVIDGVVDFEDYYAGRWFKNLYDTDEILQFFNNECASSGPACPLYANSSLLVQQRIEDIFSAVKANPLSVVDSMGSDYGIIDFGLLKRGLFLSLYKPFTALVQYASVLEAIEKGDGRPFLKLLRTVQQRPKCNSPPSMVASPDAGNAIRCGEGLGARRDIEGVARHFENLSKLSIFADIWTEIGAMTCAGWKIKVNNRYNGTFTTSTSHPLLIIGNTLDPVTPLRGAKKAAAGFKGSGLLTVNTPGHCSLAGTSPCALVHVRNYFREGVLPPEGTVCQVQDKMFGGKPKEESLATNPAERDLLDIARELSRRFHDVRDGQFL